MKRLTLLAVALVLVLGMAASASAAPEVAISGNLLVNAVWKDNWNFKNKGSKSNATEAFTVYERADLYFTITANENLKGVLGLRSQRAEFGKGNFINDTAGGAAAAGAQLNIRDAYIDFNYPGTSVNIKAGLMPVSLPAAVGGGSMIQNARTGAVVGSTALTDNVSLLAGWARLNNLNSDGAAATLSDAYVDALLLALPLNFEGFNMTPYVAYALVGDNVAANTLSGLSALNATTGKLDSAYWVGTDFTMNLFDPFILKADVAYGKSNAKLNADDRSGWLFDAALEYKGFDFMTPELFFVYTTGEDGNGTKSSKRMPILAGDWTVGSFFFGGDAITGGSLDSRDDQMGFWTIGLSLKDIQSFAEGLTHSAHIMYVAGTNSKKSLDGGIDANMSYGRALTEDDSLVEIDFNTQYKIYDELTMYTELGYISLDTKESRWGANLKGGDAYKVTTGVVYKF